MAYLTQIVVFVITANLIYSLDLGDICFNDITRESGFCKLLTRCPSAISDVRQKKRPPLCGFVAHDPIVCCVAEEINNSTATDSNGTTTLEDFNRPVYNMDVDISSKKCKEYAKLVYSYEISPVLLPEDQWVTIDKCGISAVSPGNKARPREFPHMALIGYKSSTSRDKVWKCGGTLISEQFILTSAICTNLSTYGYPKYVRLGDLSISGYRDIAEPQDIDISEFTKHPDFNELSSANDIALIKLVHPAKLNTYVRPACLPTKEVKEFKSVITSGWGSLCNFDNIYSDMLKSTLDVLDSQDCVGNGEVLGDNAFCAKARHTGTSAADQGGPAQIYNPDVYCSYTLIGVVSRWRSCGNDNKPSTFTRVSKYIDWIQRNI